MREPHGPAPAHVRQAEALLHNPYAKTADYARVVRDACEGHGSFLPGATSRIGKVGYVCLARLLDLHAGTVPGEPLDISQRHGSFVERRR